MKLGLFCHRSDLGTPLVTGLKVGAKLLGDDLEYVDPGTANLRGMQGAVVVCVNDLALLDRLRKAEVPFAFIDTGYTHNGIYWRVGINDIFPTRYLGHMGMTDRRRKEVFGWHMVKWRIPVSTGTVLICTGSDGYHMRNKLAPPDQWAKDLSVEVHRMTIRTIAIRKKGLKIPLWEQLKNAHVCIVHGSNVGLWAQLAGIPCIALGPSVIKNLSYTAISTSTLEYPYLATWDQREAWLNDIAHTQWSIAEFREGPGWEHIQERILHKGYAYEPEPQEG